MNLLIETLKQEVSTSVRFLPAVSIIMPFRPVITLKKNLEYQVKSAVSKVEAMLIAQYTVEQAVPVIIRLKNLVTALNYNTHKKSIAIFISPVVEKVFYFEMEVEEKIVIDPSFKLSDLIACKRKTKECLVLQLNENYSKTYLCSSNHSQVIKFNLFNNLNDASKNEVSGFDSFQERNESALHRFLFQMDQGLSIILKAYRLPVFISLCLNSAF